MKEWAGPSIPQFQTPISRRDFIRDLRNAAGGIVLNPVLNKIGEFPISSEVPTSCRHILPGHITADSVGIRYQLVSRAQLETKDDKNSWPAPETGIATPIEFPPYLANTTYIFGHSRQKNIPQIFNSLGEAEIGDTITIDDGVDRLTEGFIENLIYRVPERGIVVTDLETAGKIIFSVRQRTPRIILQTSLKQSYEGATFLMDFNKLQKKALVQTTRNLNDPNSYLLLLVIGELQRAA